MKRLIMAALFLPFAFSAMSQEVYDEQIEYSNDKYKVETNRFWSNWFVSVGGGAQIFFNDHSRQMDFFDRWAPALDVAVGKWFTPGIGLRFMYSGLSLKGATQLPDAPHSNGKTVDASQWLEELDMDFFNLHADVLFNMSNLLCGYNKTRFWNCSAYAGLGWGVVWESPNAHQVTADIGVLNSFRLSSAWALNLDIRGTYVGDYFDGTEGRRWGEGILSVAVGVTYNFKRRDWDRSKTIIRYNKSELEDMRNKLNEMSAENERLKKALAEGNNQEASVIVKNMAAANLVTFKINKTNLSNEARANLGMLAEIIKTGDHDIVYTITGYADKGTGTPEINQRLSEGRAQAVYNCLTEEFNVNPSQLRVDYKGGVDNMFYDDPRLSRAVITKGE